MGYFFLILTILSESAAITCMKLSNGFQSKIHAGLAFLFYGLGFVFLTLALKQIQVGLGNAIWAGASVVLVVIIGVFYFKETLNTSQIIFLLLIIIGLVGLNLTGKYID